LATLFLNPDLPNYFVSAPEVASAETARSYVPEFEAAKVVTFPNLRADVDHDFWARLDTRQYPALRKFGGLVQDDNNLTVKLHRESLRQRGVEDGLVNAICDQFQAIYAALLPVYCAVFADYAFEKKKVVWRLNTVMNENMHLDVYDEERPHHFARMFINLDTQPRIWQTSWTIDDLVEQLKGRIPDTVIREKSRADLWKELSFALFGPSPEEWWDSQPRHVAYFDPGDVWIVDSRQVAHQILYGRRALSIDFSVARESMRDPSRHYLSFVDRFRAESLQLVAASASSANSRRLRERLFQRWSIDRFTGRVGVK
jgi:hypothetical protein